MNLMLACAQPKYLQNAVVQNPDMQNPDSTAGKIQADCTRQLKNSKLCIVWMWETKPTETTLGAFIFKTYRLNNYDQSAILLDAGDKAEVVLWMSSMGHGSSPTVVQKLDVGTYRVNEVFFTMPGQWQMQFQFKNQNEEIIDEASFEIQI